MIRLFAIFAVLPFVGVFATQHEWVVRKIVHSDDGSLIGCNIGCVICGAGLNYPIANVENGWCTCHSPQRAVRVVSQHLCYTNPENNADELPFADGVNPRLADMSPAELAAIDWDSTADNISPDVQMLQYYPNGQVVTAADGSRGVATQDSNGNMVVVPFVDGSASGYQNGHLGTYTLTPHGDNLYSSSFTPAWTGGASDSGSSSPVNNGSGSSVSVVPFGSGSTVFDQPQTENRTDGNGQSYSVVSVPAQTVNLGNGSSITLYDYSGLLNAIGSNVSSGFDKLHEDNDIINENLRKQLESDGVPDVAENVDPSVSDSSVTSEVNEQLDLVRDSQSGWGFDFGTGSNPIGNMITRLIGNPPTNFGTQDNVCQVDFSLPLVGTITYSFRLSDWFPSAFRSCILMILSIFFAIASAHAISGAFQ